MSILVDCVWNVMAHAQKLDFFFWPNGRVHLNRRGRQFSSLLAAEVSASAVVMLDTPCSEVVWRVLATQHIRQFPLHFPSRASPCAIRFQLDSKSDRLTSDLSTVSINFYTERCSVEKTTVSIDSIFDCYLLEPHCLLKIYTFMQHDLKWQWLNINYQLDALIIIYS